MAKPVGWGKKYVFLRPEGQVRQSQIITTYGAGALIDLVDQAVLVGGLDFWSYGSAKGIPIIQEPRLRDALAESFRIAGRPLSFENAFREPPAGDGRQPQRAVGIQVLEMPRWFVCQNRGAARSCEATASTSKEAATGTSASRRRARSRCPSDSRAGAGILRSSRGSTSRTGMPNANAPRRA